MTKARDLANIISGGFTADDIPNIDASKITSGSIADARIPASAVSQHATSFDDNKIVNDISTLAIRQASNENKGAYNSNSMSVDVFQDDTGIDTETNTNRNASEYVSSVGTSTESGGTEKSPNSLSITNYGSPYNITFNSSVPDTIQIQSGYGGSYNFGAYSSQQISNKFWIRWHISSLNGSSESTNNPKFQFGIMNSADTINLGQNLYTNNKANSFWLGYQGSGGGKIITYKGNTIQSQISKTLGTGHSLQLVCDGTDLKLYHSSSSNTWYDNGADLIHTYSNYLDNNGNKRFLTAAGLNNWSSNQQLATNFSWKDNITTLGGLTSLNSTGNFTGTTITAPSSVSSMGAIITYQDEAGTNALNTDIVLQLSADGGSNFTTATMTAMPDFASGIKMAKVNDLSVTAGTQLKYKISFANQASGSKEARIRGVSLQY